MGNSNQFVISLYFHFVSIPCRLEIVPNCIEGASEADVINSATGTVYAFFLASLWNCNHC